MFDVIGSVVAAEQVPDMVDQVSQQLAVGRVVQRLGGWQEAVDGSLRRAHSASRITLTGKSHRFIVRPPLGERRRAAQASASVPRPMPPI